jgi:hypothetical protein
VKQLFILFCLLLSASSVQQKTIVFAEPIDALSVAFESFDDTASIHTGHEWVDLAVENEQDPTLRESNLVILPKPTTRVTMRGDFLHMQLHPITVSKEPVSYAIAATRSVGRPRILKRHQWGADDSFLFSAPVSTASSSSSTAVATSSNGSASSKRADDCNAAKTNYPGDFQVTRTVTHDGNGKKLRWARRYSPDVKVLAVHHTAQKIRGDLRSPVERMRALYAFHANSRGWGDIGYHYLIDEEGTIYEGRSGGKNVVGGHVYCGNVGTLGVALMGNFDEEQPTQVQVHALQWLLQDLAQSYDIPLNRNTYFHGKNMKTIVRHKDLISTECPGHYMSAAISQVRNNVIAGNIDNNVTFPTIARKRTDNRETRLSTRLEKAGEAMSRRFFRAKRLVRTAERKNPNDARLQMIEKQKSTGSNIQRQRAAETARRRRIAEARRATAAPVTRTASTARPTDIDPHALRIRLSYEGNNAEISTTGSATINGTSVKNVRLGREGHNCIAVSAGQTVADGIVRIHPGDNVLRIDSWNTAWNRFRGVLECQIVDGQLVLINELPLEDYMAGLSEQPDTEHYEKQRAFAIAARSYAAYYMEDGHTKFAGKPYHGSDTGKSFQSYSGVKFEEQNPNWVRAVLDTAHLVVSKNDLTVKTAYFSSDDGRTRSPAENGWHNFPFAEVFSSKPDPWCDGMRLHGHGVGMSGCGAKAQAKEGKTAEQILRYYYPGTAFKTLD